MTHPAIDMVDASLRLVVTPSGLFTMPDDDPSSRPTTSPTDRGDGEVDRDVRFRDVSPALEYVFWVFVVLAPLLFLANGPPVTGDQAVFQVAMTVTALVAAIGFRLYNAATRSK